MFDSDFENDKITFPIMFRARYLRLEMSVGSFMSVLESTKNKTKPID